MSTCTWHKFKNKGKIFWAIIDGDLSQKTVTGSSFKVEKIFPQLDCYDVKYKSHQAFKNQKTDMINTNFYNMTL